MLHLFCITKCKRCSPRSLAQQPCVRFWKQVKYVPRSFDWEKDPLDDFDWVKVWKWWKWKPPRSSIAIIFFDRFARFVPKGFFWGKLGSTYNFQPLYSYTLQMFLFDRQGKTSENIFLLKGMNPCILKISCTQKATNIQFYSKVVFKASCPTASMQILIVHAVSYLSSASAICEKVKVSLIFYIRDVILTATNLT